VFKRIYLIVTLLIALIIPIISITYYITPSTYLSNHNIELQQELSNISSLDNYNSSDSYLISVFVVIYYLGVLFFSLKFFKTLRDIFLKIKSNQKKKTVNFTYVLIEDLKIPHTFFNYIFFNKKEFKANQTPKEVLWHEQTHAIQKHSLDLVFIELFQIFFWFNPLIYIIKKDIRLNHEFLADEAVLSKGVSPTIYQQTLLNFSTSFLNQSLTNSLNYSSIKKRFEIMKKSSNKRILALKIFILLPLISVLFFSFSNERIELKTNFEVNKSVYIKYQDTINYKSKTKSYKLSLVKKSPIFKGCKLNSNEFEIRKCLSESLTSHFENQFNFEIARDIIQTSDKKFTSAFFIINKNGIISEIRSFPINKKLNDEFVRVLNLVPKFKPGLIKGKPVNVKYRVSMNLENDIFHIKSRSYIY